MIDFDKELSPIFTLYSQIEIELMQNIAKRFIVDTELGGTTAYWVDRLSDLGGLRKENIELIAGLSAKTNQQIYDSFAKLGYSHLQEQEPSYNNAYENGVLDNTPVNFRLSKTLKNILNIQVKNAIDRTNLTNTTALESSLDAYKKINNKLLIEVSSGIYDYNTSLRKAMKQLSIDGITGATYTRKDGSEIHYPLDSAIRRNLFTSSAKTVDLMQDERMNEWGADLCEITSYNGARPLCSLDQGYIFSMSGKNKKYRSWSSSTHGEPAGILGINCGHLKYVYFEGLSEQKYFPYDKEENDKHYAIKQKETKLSLEVRNAKRMVFLNKANKDTQAFKNASVKLKEKEKELKEFKKVNNLKGQPNVWVNKKTFDN